MNTKPERGLYSTVLREHVSDITFRRWPYLYHCGIWEKHQPDENGCTYRIILNRTKGIDCGKRTLVHELMHICDDLNGIERSNADTEGKAMDFYFNNRRFMDYLYLCFLKHSVIAHYR